MCISRELTWSFKLGCTCIDYIVIMKIYVIAAVTFFIIKSMIAEKSRCKKVKGTSRWQGHAVTDNPEYRAQRDILP